MNKVGILQRVFNRTNKEDIIEIIKERITGWTPTSPKKVDLEPVFLELANLIKDNEIEDFVEMAVMRKNQGLPAYTYKVANLRFLEGKGTEEIEKEYKKINTPFKTAYAISVEEIVNEEEFLQFKIRLKEYNNSFITGIKSTENLSAVYRASIRLNKHNKMVTIFAGDQDFHEIIVEYLKSIFKWPLESYEITVKTHQSAQIQSASFKTSSLFDFMYNRLSARGIKALWVGELKFKVSKKQIARTKIKNVTINGEDILMSQLACEYISLGSDIIFTKVSFVKDKQEFTCKIYLQGKKNNILKFVIQDNSDEVFCNDIMEILQEEYIRMCTDGILDINATKQRMEKVYEKFIQSSEGSLNEAINNLIKENSLNTIKCIAEISTSFNLQDEFVVKQLREFVHYNKTILNTVGFGEDSEELLQIKELLGESPTDEATEELEDTEII
ncbi:TPA: hypothetical protein ACIQN5_002700 [Bacillus cereus]